MITKNEINEYIKNIKKQLLYGTKESKLFLKELKQNILDFADENKNADIADIRNRFGTEEEVATIFFEQYSKEDIKKKLRIRNAVVACVVAVALIFTGCIIYETIKSQKYDPGYIIVHDAQENDTSPEDDENSTSLAE